MIIIVLQIFIIYILFNYRQELENQKINGVVTMKKYEEKEEMCKWKELNALICDICGKAAKEPDWPWDNNGTRTNITELYCVSGNTVDAPIKEYIFDICPECFINKLIPLMKEKFNIDPQVTVRPVQEV